MQTDLSDLPKSKRRELTEVVRLINKEAKVEMIILYGSYAHGDWKEEHDLDPDRWSGQAFDYDILIVVAEPARAEDELFCKRVVEALNNTPFSTHVRPIVHDVNEINMALAEGRYFFRDLREQGRLLYDSGRFELAEPKNTQATR
jgi:predicted nucleotidyltransferase